MKIFCERFNDLRREKGVSTITALGVSNSTITRWENGLISPSIDHLHSIAQYFNVSADYLIGLSNNF